MMMMMMMMIALTGAVEDFVFAISSLRRELSPTLTLKWPERNHVQTTYNSPRAYHVQHAVCHVVGKDSSAIKFNRVEITFILALFS